MWRAPASSAHFPALSKQEMARHTPFFMDSPTLLTHFETCDRKGAWSRDWEKHKLDNTDFIQLCIRAGLTSSRPDFGEAADEQAMGLGAEPGLDSKEHNLYDQVVHLAAISDIVTQAVRKPSEPPWLLPEPVQLGDGSTWHPNGYMDPSGTFLRRIALVSSWNNDRHYAECKSWESLGEICAYNMPMQLVVAVIGQNKGGKRHSYWSHGLRHPVSKQLRFRKRNDKSSPFKSSWIEVWREDFDEITTQAWLEAMLQDAVLTDVLFKIDIKIPEKAARDRIRDLAAKRLDKIAKIKTLPDENLSSCSWPTKCLFIRPCHNGDIPSGRYGFVSVDSISGMSASG